MKNVNTNNEKIKYLTYEDILKRLNKLKNKKYLYRLVSHRDYVDLSKLNDEITTGKLIEELMQLPKDCVNLIKQFLSLTDNNIEHYYILLDRLLFIYQSLMVSPRSYGDKLYRRHKDKTALLKKSLKILQNLNSNDYLFYMLHKEKENKLPIDLPRILLNEKYLLNYLLENIEYIKQSPKYNRIKDGVFFNLSNQR